MGWRQLFPIVLLFSCVDGFFVNLFYPSRLALLAKDILILIVYIFFILQESANKWVFQFKRSIGFGIWYLAMMFIAVGMLQIFNPGVPGVLVGVLGFKTMFFYWPLAILTYAYIDSPSRMRGLLRKIVYFSIPICLFGLIQFWKPPDYMIREFGEGFRRALVITYGRPGSAGFLRVLGTFASSGQFSAFLLINTMFVFGLLFTVKNKTEKLIMIGCLVLSYITMLATGSRGWSLLFFPATILFVIFCRWLWRTFFIILLLGLSFNFGFSYLGKAVLARFQTVQDIGMIKQRTLGTTGSEFARYLQEYPFGRGIGTGSSSSGVVAGIRKAELGYLENYFGKLQYEVGIVGLILFYLFLLSLTIHWLKYWLKSPDPATYTLVSALTAYCFVIFCVTFVGVIDSPPVGIFLWVIIGMVAKAATFQLDDQYPLST